MLVKVISLVFSSAHGGFDDSELQEFIKGKDVVSVQEHLFVRNEIPYLTLIVKYLPQKQAVAETKPAVEEKGEEPWRAALSQAQDMDLFNVLRDWRGIQCRKESVPPYIVFTNKQLADIVKRRPTTLIEFGQVEGIGKSRAEKYANDVMAIIKKEGAGNPGQDPGDGVNGDD